MGTPVRVLSYGTLAVALVAWAPFFSLSFRLLGCTPVDDLCGLQVGILGLQLYFCAVGLSLITALVALIPLARSRRWGRLALVVSLGVLPPAFVVGIQVLTKMGTAVFTPTLANSLPLLAALTLLPILIFGLFFASDVAPQS